MIQCAICPNPAALQWAKVDPADSSSTVPVFACATHEISLDLASRVHQSACTAPNPTNLPNCDCTPTAPH